MRPVMLLATGRKCATTRETLRRKRVQKRGVGGEGEGGRWGEYSGSGKGEGERGGNGGKAY